MNRNTYSSEFTVPSLSLTSSRSKRLIPNKDINLELPRPIQGKGRADMMDRINRPPIFSSKIIKDAKGPDQSSNFKPKNIPDMSKNNQISSLNKNVYLKRQQQSQIQVTFRRQIKQSNKQKPAQTMIRSPSSNSILRNPESRQVIATQIQKRMQSKKIDVNKSLFQRRISKLFQQAQFYEKQMMQTYQDNSSAISKQLDTLQQYRKSALSFRFSQDLVGI